MYEVLFRYEDDFGPPYLAEVISEEETRVMVRKHKREPYDELFEERL
jgi:hypothetical protein